MTPHPDVSARGPFVGRAREMRALLRCHEDGARLVTITGTAGMGKTRLALEWARSGAGAKVFFCDLSDATSVDDACAIVARALAVPLAAGGSADDAVSQLGRALAESGESVVILDNLEQLVATTPRLLIPWLALAPRARFVVTSRERLRIDAEVCLEVEPLGLPTAEERSLREVASSEAVQLFVARGRATRLDFELTEADAGDVAAIVRSVDGIPLAIELCAARMGVLAPKQILKRLARRFELLATGARGAPARKATLRGAIDWSWDLLEAHEKDALAQCSVFRGGFSLAAAEGVIDLRVAPRGETTLDVLQSLHEKSLVRAFDVPGERRHGLLESIREYAEERLFELGAAAPALARHAAFFLATSTGDVRRLALEADNLTAVCTRALAKRPLTPADADTALRALLLLEPVLLMCAAGRLEPYIAMLDAALAIEPIDDTGSDGPMPSAAIVRARALYTRALADLFRGRVLDCLQGFHRALDAAREAGSRADEALALTKIGLLLDRADQPGEARSCFDRARAIAVELRSPALTGDWMLACGGALLWRGRAADAAAHAEQALESLCAAGDLRGQSVACAQLAQAHLSLGRLDEAERAAARTLALLEATEDRRTEGYVLGIVGRIEQARGRFGDARAKLAAASAIHAAVGDRWSQGVLRGYLGNLAFEEGHLDDAREALESALALLHGTGERHYAAVLAGALGAVEIGLGRGDTAASRFESAEIALEGVRVQTTKITVDLYRAFADVQRADRATAAGDLETAERHRGAVAATIALARAPAPDGALPPALSSEDVRLAIRLLERGLARPPSTDAIAERSPALATLVVGPEARWFRVRDREPVHMLKARAARLLLARLVRRRMEAPGQALSLEALFDTGWPGERVARSAAANRVHVTLSKLRRLGLAGLLQSRDDGFLLDPAGIVIEALDPDKP